MLRLFKTKIIWTILLIVLFLSRLYAPVQKIQDSVFSKLSSNFSLLFSSQNDLQEQLALKDQQILQLQMQLSSMLGASDLKNSASAFSKEVNQRFIQAKVLAINPSLILKSLQIDKGSDQGIRLGAAVLGVQGESWGLVGMITQVYKNTSELMLVTDARFQVGAQIKNKSQQGLLRGMTQKLELERIFLMNRLEYLQSFSDISEMDEVQTSGVDGFFPKGIPLGKVTQISRDEKNVFLSAEVVSNLDFNLINTVFVLLP